MIKKAFSIVMLSVILSITFPRYVFSEEPSSNEALKKVLQKARLGTDTKTSEAESNQVAQEEPGQESMVTKAAEGFDQDVKVEKVFTDDEKWGESYIKAIKNRKKRVGNLKAVKNLETERDNKEKGSLNDVNWGQSYIAVIKKRRGSGSALLERSNVKERTRKIKLYTKMARYYLGKEKFDNAKKYAEKARQYDTGNEEIKELLKEIVRRGVYEEDTYPLDKDKMLEDSAEKNKYDVVAANKETESLVAKVRGMFSEPKRYELTQVEKEKVYSVDECVELALARNPRLRINEDQIKLAEMKLVEAYRDLFPDIDLKLERSSGKIGSDNLPRHYRGEKYKADVKQTLFDGMGTWYALRQSKINLEVNKQEKIKTRNEIIESVKTAYYDLDKAIKNLSINENHMKEVNGYFSIMEKAFESGVISRSEYLKIKAQNLQANFKYASAKEDMGLAKMNLVRLLNMDQDDNIDIKPVESPKQTLSIGLENCYSLALANEPDLRIKSKTVEFYNFERKMKKAAGWPKIEFDGSFGMSYENFEPLIIATDYDNAVDASGPVRAGRGLEAEWYAGVKGSVPLWGNTLEYNYVKEKWTPTVSSFRGAESATSTLTLSLLDKLSYFSDLQEARAGFYNAQYEYDKAKNDLMAQVKEAYFKYRKALLQMEISRSELDYQKNNVEILKEQMKMGEVEASRVVEELGKLAEDEYALYQSDADYYSSLASINRSVGIPDYFKPEYEN